MFSMCLQENPHRHRKNMSGFSPKSTQKDLNPESKTRNVLLRGDSTNHHTAQIYSIVSFGDWLSIIKEGMEVKGSYSDQYMTRHTNNNSEKQHNGGKQKQRKHNQTKWGDTENQEIRGTRGETGSELEQGGSLSCRWPKIQHVQTDRQHRHSWGTDTNQFTLTVTVPAQLAGWLCHLEMLRQSLQERRGYGQAAAFHGQHIHSNIHRFVCN